MNKIKLIALGLILCLSVITSGCAVVSTAVAAGISYAIYQATK